MTNKTIKFIFENGIEVQFNNLPDDVYKSIVESTEGKNTVVLLDFFSLIGNIINESFLKESDKQLK